MFLLCDFFCGLIGGHGEMLSAREIKAVMRHDYLEGCSLVWDKVRLSSRSGFGGSCTG
jgi:hypothetical protein